MKKAVIFFFIALVFSFSAAPARAVQISDILSIIEKHSFYSVSPKELADMRECFIGRALTRIEISKDEELSEDLLLESCFAKDKYAGYLSSLEAKLMDQESFGSFIGVGVEIFSNPATKGIKIMKVLEGGSAEESGLFKEGDIIVGIGDSSQDIKGAREMSVSEAAALIRGKEGTKVFLEVERNSLPIGTFSLERKKVELVKLTMERPEAGVAHLKIKSFSQKRMVIEDMLPILLSALNEGRHNLVLDFRGNTGGFLREAEHMINAFSPDKGMLWLEQKFRSGEKSKLSHTFMKGVGFRVAILTDKYSASASEIVAGVLRIWGAKIFGEKTYGKGSVQTLFVVPGGGELQLTTSKYYFADGTTPDGVGLYPDVEVLDDPATPDKDEQLEAAINWLKSGN